ncbi:unnamed protein product [Tetraodon nigroviridis]|uniref:(spotted green pufferfish) hypothetical protein n=1 Tax=Tetraodon nigroviridis TaxID=99883 RepID=Q4SKL9_TETNG|nr:unnamed protein product [Tetraodon nigroviridis]
MVLTDGAVFVPSELRTSTPDLQYDLAASLPEGGRRLFDTHAVVRLFEENGFTAQQAEAMVKILVRMTQSNMEVIYGDMVTKAQQVRPAPGGGSSPSRRNICRRVFVASGDHVPARDVPDHCCEEGHGHPGEERVLRSAGRERGGRLPHQPPLSSSEVLNRPICLQKLKIQILKLKDHLVDEMNKVRSETLLDMNLEKSHVKELKDEHEKKLLERRTELMEMSAEHDCHLTQTNMKIDTEVAGLKTMLESHKLDTIKYLAGSVFTCLTVVLGFYRIWM